MRTIPMESRCSEKITLPLQFGLVHVSKRGLGKQIYVLVFTKTVHSLQSQNDREAQSVLYRVVQKKPHNFKVFKIRYRRKCSRQNETDFTQMFIDFKGI